MSLPYAEVIGDPIAHSKSPLIHGFWLEKLGLEAQYTRCRVTTDGLGEFFAERRAIPAWKGCNITIPHKEAVLPFLDGVEDAAQAIGAVNTVFRGESGDLIGTNTDIEGVAEALVGAEDTDSAVVIGNGGAARAAFAHLARIGSRDVRIIARDPAKAMRVADECGLTATAAPFDPDADRMRGAHIVINATQLGMDGQPPMPTWIGEQLERTADRAVVFDMVYAPLETALLAAAGKVGRARADGLVMLVGQAAAAFERFFGVPAPRQYDAGLRAILTA
ncbi:shikimate dehydrogenase family protein [Novosphingobium aquimarinum]|uniref:shikimate dehydrogenase family protein n=1 Tax=Novosphingobium aquimarinum TaxID=2682494 RepID=UPI0012EB6DD7|nr:shikimate dehydrogenase [Novosphingobium aquimarinum]